jgi:radical SAM protein with 4Fe4S-binding SPASM domain
MVRKMRYGFLIKEHEIFPPIVHVENTNICNINCIHCPQSDPYKLVPGYKPQTMKLEILKKIVAEVAKHNCALRYTPDGETLLPGNFKDQLRLIFEKGIYLLALNTNGLLLEGEILKRFLQPGKTRVAIEISLDALYRDSYEKIRVNSNYNRVLKNVLTLLYERDMRGLKNQLKVMVSIINQPELKHGELEEFLKFWEPLADKVIRRTYVDTKGLMPQKDCPVEKNLDNKIHMENSEERWPCLVPFTRLVITYDGSIRFCPDDWKKETIVGNILDKSLAEIWSFDRMKRLRESHLDRSFQHETCQRCTDWKAIKWGYDYTVALNDLFGEQII